MIMRVAHNPEWALAVQDSLYDQDTYMERRYNSLLVDIVEVNWFAITLDFRLLVFYFAKK